MVSWYNDDTIKLGQVEVLKKNFQSNIYKIGENLPQIFTITAQKLVIIYSDRISEKHCIFLVYEFCIIFWFFFFVIDKLYGPFYFHVFKGLINFRARALNPKATEG